MIWVVSPPIIRSKHNCICQTVTAIRRIVAGSSNSLTSTRCCRYSCLCSWWWVEIPPKTCRAVFQEKINCGTLHLVGYILEYTYDAWPWTLNSFIEVSPWQILGLWILYNKFLINVTSWKLQSIVKQQSIGHFLSLTVTIPRVLQILQDDS